MVRTTRGEDIDAACVARRLVLDRTRRSERYIAVRELQAVGARKLLWSWGMLMILRAAAAPLTGLLAVVCLGSTDPRNRRRSPAGPRRHIQLGSATRRAPPRAPDATAQGPRN